jgi:hypothetical protein
MQFEIITTIVQTTTGRLQQIDVDIQFEDKFLTLLHHLLKFCDALQYFL